MDALIAKLLILKKIVVITCLRIIDAACGVIIFMTAPLIGLIVRVWFIGGDWLNACRSAWVTCAACSAGG